MCNFTGSNIRFLNLSVIAYCFRMMKWYHKRLWIPCITLLSSVRYSSNAMCEALGPETVFLLLFPTRIMCCDELINLQLQHNNEIEAVFNCNTKKRSKIEAIFNCKKQDFNNLQLQHIIFYCTATNNCQSSTATINCQSSTATINCQSSTATHRQEEDN